MNAAIPLKERILAAAAATPSPTRTQGRRLTALLLGVSIAIGLVLFELAGGIAHARARPLLVTVRLADGWALAASWLTWMMARQSAPQVPSRRLLVGASIVSPFVMCAWAPMILFWMSVWKPFMTDRVVISAATPTVTPATPIEVVTNAKSPLRLARR